MIAAALIGIGSGALHAVAGPDHSLSLMPYSSSASRPARALHVGLLWGVGHSIGTLTLAAVLMLTLRHVDLTAFSNWGNRLAGFALLVMGLRGALSRLTSSSERRERSTAGPLTVGLIHGLTGAAALVLILPQLVQGSLLEQAVYLSGFAVGSTLAMGLFTGALSLLARRNLSVHHQQVMARVASWGSVVLGITWMSAD